MEIPQVDIEPVNMDQPQDPDVNQSVLATEASSPSFKIEPSSTPAHGPSDKLRQFQDVAVGFLANASNETLGACALGLCASTYFVLGRFGLVLIGAVGGVVLHATWEGSHSSSEGASPGEVAKRRKELGLEVVKRALEWRDTKERVDETHAAALKVEASALTKSLDYSNFRPEVSAALTELTDAVIRDYVHWWYKPLLPVEESFPASCRQTLTSFIVSFANHLSRKRAADPFLDFIANSTSIIIVFLNELATALRASQRTDVQEALRTYLKYQPESNLANVISSEQHERKLRLVADDILQSFLDSKTYNCAPARTFLLEVLAILVLQSTVHSCAKPEWINEWIVYLLEDGEPELMNVIDAGVEDMEEKMKNPASARRPTLQEKTHQRRVSRAEEAMQEAMREAQRLNEMIAEDEARRKKGLPHTDTDDSLSSTATTDVGMATPTSSDSDGQRLARRSTDSSVIFDNEGNVIPSARSSPKKQVKPAFTDFDQLAPANVPTALQTEYTPPAPTEVMVAVPLTLHNASITILDMGETNDKAVLKQKPNDEMLIQIEPASSRFPGWMVTRKYADYEPLHETLRRIAVVSGVPEFAQQYPTVPAWKSYTRAQVIQELEKYLSAAVKADRLAESEAMKKFLDKETGLEKAPAANKNVLLQGSAALENVGKGFVTAIGQGGKGIQTGFQTGGKAFQTGGKAILGGVQGVFGAVAGGVGPKRPAIGRSGSSYGQGSTSPVVPQSRFSQDLARSSGEAGEPVKPRPSQTTSSRTSLEQSYLSSQPPPIATPSTESLNLPPPPSEISDEFEPRTPGTPSQSQPRRSGTSSRPLTPIASAVPSAVSSPAKVKESANLTSLPEPSDAAEKTTPEPSSSSRKQDIPLTEEETRVSIDLVFAIITELFALAPSAWTIRLSLLSAAKSYLVRPANPQLESIRVLLQESVIDANLTSDAGLATHIRKLRENTLPTEEERAKWPAEMTAEEKEKLRVKARNLLVERGMPSALTGVMGQAACGEALGRVFDCLQVQEVARGLIFALLLQAVRAVTQ